MNMPSKGITKDRAVYEATRAVQIVWVHRSVAVIYPSYERDFADYIRTGRGPLRKGIGIANAKNMADAKKKRVAHATGLALAILGCDYFNAFRVQEHVSHKGNVRSLSTEANVAVRVSAAIAWLQSEDPRIREIFDLRVKHHLLLNAAKYRGII
jgi:hypothetical protein